MTYLKKLLAWLVQPKSYQTDVERFITSHNPTNAFEVDNLLKQYYAKSDRGFL